MKYKKYILLPLLAVLFAASGLYNSYNSKDYLLCLNDPIGQDKTEIGLSGIVISKDNDNLIVIENIYGREVLLKSVYENWKKGQLVNFKGLFHKEGYVEYKGGELIWNKKIKFEFSAIGLIYFFIIFFRDKNKLKFSF